MNLNSTHLRAIQLLIDNTNIAGQTENPRTVRHLHRLADKLGIKMRTLYKWRVDPDFQAEYQKTLDEWAKNLLEIPLAIKKRRLLELQRLYDITPDSAIEKVIHAKGRVYDPETKQYVEVDANIIDTNGEILVGADGKPISVVAFRKLNIETKMKLLEQIREEVEPCLTRAEMTRKEADGSSTTYVFESGAPQDFPRWGDGSAPLQIEDAQVMPAEDNAEEENE